MSDHNLLSFVGPADDAKEVDGLRLDGTGYTDALKCSNLRGARFSNFEIIGGSEDCIDVNRGGSLSFRQGKLSPKGKFACTLKGGLQEWLMEDVTIIGHGTETDIDLGNWSDQQQAFSARTTGGVLRRVRSSDGSQICIRVLNATRPVVEDCGPIKWKVVPRLLVWAWWTMRRNQWIG